LFHYVTKFKRRNEFYSANLIILLLPTVENDENYFSSSIVLPYSSTNCKYINPFKLIHTIHAQFHTSINHKHLFKRVYFSLHSPERNSPHLPIWDSIYLLFLWIKYLRLRIILCSLNLWNGTKTEWQKGSRTRRQQLKTLAGSGGKWTFCGIWNWRKMRHPPMISQYCMFIYHRVWV